MKNNIEERVGSLRKTRNIVISLLVGSLTGAALMLLFAPQSGKQMRFWIQQRSISLPDRTQAAGVPGTRSAGKMLAEAA